MEKVKSVKSVSIAPKKLTPIPAKNNKKVTTLSPAAKRLKRAL